MSDTRFSLSQIPAPMVFATHRIISDCNERFAALFGYERYELVNKGFHLLYPKFSDFVRTGKMWQANFAGAQSYYDERIMLHRDRSRFWCQVHGLSEVDGDPFARAIYCFEPINRVVRRGEHGLSERQLQIVTLVAQGKKNREISQEVGISVRTVEAHRARIMARIGVRNGAELVAWFQGK